MIRFPHKQFERKDNYAAGGRAPWVNVGLATNEYTVTGGQNYFLKRTYDDYGRLSQADGLNYAYAPDGQLESISNAALELEFHYTPDRLDAGYSITLTDGSVITRETLRDFYQRGLVIAVTNRFNNGVINKYNYTYDALGRPTDRNADTFGYNQRSEVASAAIGTNSSTYAYDEIGNQRNNIIDSVKTDYTANNLNQYLRVLAPSRDTTLSYDLDGNLLTNDLFSYTYDSANRLTSVSSNGTPLVENRYDTLSRRIQKITSNATHTYFYDGWNLAHETISTASGVTTNQYVWGKDLSGTLQGAGGVGGLLAVSIDGAWYFPFYDNNGNITAYTDETGTIVAEYTYDAFGRTLAATGSLADIFPHRFSTKYYDSEAGLYSYGYRFYSPELMRWMNRDPIEEEGGVNQYAFIRNSAIFKVDILGRIEAPLDSFFIGKQAKHNINRHVQVYLYYIPKGSSFTTIKIDRFQNHLEVEAGGALKIVTVPKFGTPPGIRAPLDIPGKGFFGSGYGSIDGMFVPREEWDTPVDFWGDAEEVNRTSTAFGSYPIYVFENANFNFGRFIKVRRKGEHRWSEAFSPSRTEMFRVWHTFSNSVGVDDVNASVTGLECGDVVSIQIGSQGERPLAWRQTIKIK